MITGNEITAQEIVTAIVTRYPHSPARNCIQARRAQIEANLNASNKAWPEMPMLAIATIGFLETHLGCARGQGGNWGAPISRFRRNVAGSPLQAAHILWTSYVVCDNNWESAARRFRTGLCRPTKVGSRYGRKFLNTQRAILMQVLLNREITEFRVCR
jgi:hypothetical protein